VKQWLKRPLTQHIEAAATEPERTLAIDEQCPALELKPSPNVIFLEREKEPTVAESDGVPTAQLNRAVRSFGNSANSAVVRG
jgi:hypothetical protein